MGESFNLRQVPGDLAGCVIINVQTCLSMILFVSTSQVLLRTSQTRITMKLCLSLLISHPHNLKPIPKTTKKKGERKGKKKKLDKNTRQEEDKMAKQQVSKKQTMNEGNETETMDASSYAIVSNKSGTEHEMC